jgi:serine/threonine protein kinase
MPFEDELIGKTLKSSKGDYLLSSLHASGSRTFIYRAQDVKTKKTVAIKILNPAIASTQTEKSRFHRSMSESVNSKFFHKNILRVYNAHISTITWAVMEFIEGPSALALMYHAAAERMDWRDVWFIARDVAAALHHISSLGLVHRNVLPSNILRRGMNADSLQAKHTWILSGLTLTKQASAIQVITAPGELVGEMAFLPPESTYGAPSTTDIRSDMYGLGMTLYVLLSGDLPFADQSEEAVLRTIRSTDEFPDNIRTKQLTVRPEFADIVMKLIRKNPDSRFSSTAELLTSLEKVRKMKSKDFERYPE